LRKNNTFLAPDAVLLSVPFFIFVHITNSQIRSGIMNCSKGQLNLFRCYFHRFECDEMNCWAMTLRCLQFLINTVGNGVNSISSMYVEMGNRLVSSIKWARPSQENSLLTGFPSHIKTPLAFRIPFKFLIPSENLAVFCKYACSCRWQLAQTVFDLAEALFS